MKWSGVLNTKKKYYSLQGSFCGSISHRLPREECPIPGRVQGQSGWGCEKAGLVDNVGIGWPLRSFCDSQILWYLVLARWSVLRNSSHEMNLDSDLSIYNPY